MGDTAHTPPPAFARDAPPERRAAATALDALLRVMHLMRGHFEQAAGELGLNPSQAMALRSLGEPMPMREVADQLRCDPSHVTGIVDHLTGLGAVERLADPRDRRVKLLAITEEGRALRRELEARLLDGMPLRASLDDDDLTQLADLLARVAPAAETDGLLAV